MFSLIISIISIALVAALAAATVYFGGAAFNKGAAGADASAFINAGQQIAGAFTLASTDGYSISTATITNLATAGGVGSGSPIYLAQAPTYKGVAPVIDANGYAAVKVSSAVCLEIVKKNDTAATIVPVLAAIPAVLYGCAAPTAAGDLTAGSLTTEYVAYYKVK